MAAAQARDGGVEPPLPARPAILHIAGRGHVRVEGTNPTFRQEIVDGKDLQLKPGAYSLTDLCGNVQKILLKDGENKTYVLACEFEVILQRGREAMARQNPAEAEQVLKGALQKLHGREQLPLYNLLLFERGTSLAAQHRLSSALDDWNAVWDRMRKGTQVKGIPSIEEEFHTWNGQVGRLIIKKQEGGRCITVSDQLLFPGAQPNLKFLDKSSQAQTVVIRASQSTELNLCPGASPAGKRP
jgi:hypothetical protein